MHGRALVRGRAAAPPRLHLGVEVELVRVRPERDLLRAGPLELEAGRRSTSGVKTSPRSRYSWSASSASSASSSEPGRPVDAGLLLGAHLVDVAVDRGRRLDLVDDAVEAGHQLGAERQVRVAGRVRRAELEAPRAGRREVRRDADAGRAVALAVDEVDRRLVAGDEPAVASSSSARRTRGSPSRASAGRRCSGGPSPTAARSPRRRRRGSCRPSRGSGGCACPSRCRRRAASA